MSRLSELDFSDLATAGEPVASIAELDFSDLAGENKPTQPAIPPMTDQEQTAFDVQSKGTLGGIMDKAKAPGEVRDLADLKKEFPVTAPIISKDPEYQKKVQYAYEQIMGLPDSAKTALALGGPLANVLNLPSWLSKKFGFEMAGTLGGVADKDKGTLSAIHDAINLWKENVPLASKMGAAKVAGGIARVATEFRGMPGKSAPVKFASQELTTFPTTQQSEAPMGEYIAEKGLATAKAAGTGFGVGAAQKYIPNPLFRVPTVTGGFMALTALEGGTPEQILESGITVLGFEALGLVEKGLGPKVIAEKAREHNPKLKDVPDEVIAEAAKQLSEIQKTTETPSITSRPQATPAAISEKPTTEPPARAAAIVEPPIASKVERPRLSDLDFGDLTAENRPQETPKPTPLTQPVIDAKNVPIVEVPVDKLKLSKDVPNFKEAADKETGVVLGQELEGRYERLATAPILVWERDSGDLEVITGRHRLDLARRTGETTIPAQVVRESEGFTKTMALTMDAESNIREGQGGVKDYAQYFRANQEITEADARTRGLLSRSKGQSGFRIGKSAVDDVYAAFIGGKLNESKAAAIAAGAPNSESAQLAAISKADTMSPDELEQFARILTRSTPSDKLKPKQGNLFGFDDTALLEAEAVAREVGKESASIKQRIMAVKGALRRPDIARKMGLEFSDEKAIQAEVNRLELRLDDLKRTSTTPALWREMKLRAGLGEPGYSGETPEMFDKAEYPINEPDVPGQQRMALEGPPRGGRETGATSLIPDMISEGLTLGRKLAKYPTTFVSSTAKMLWRNVRRGTNHIRTLGGAGKLLAKDLDEITFRITRNANNDRLDLQKAFAGLNSEQRQAVAKIINGRLNTEIQPTKLVERANRVREILDRSMKAGAELEMSRKVKGKQVPLAGSGKAYPQVPNKAGVEFLNEAEAKGLGSAKVFAWAQEQVKSGNYETVDEAVNALRSFREIHIRGLNPYLEAERVELPDEYIEWDGASILPHLVERNWMTVEGVRQWGKDFGRVYSRLEQIRSKYGPKAAKRVETFISTSFGKMSPASTEAQNISNIVRGYQYATKVGISPITILRNMFDRFAKMLVISQNPKVVATALKEYPPFANAFMESARKLEDKVTRAGAVFGHGSIAEGYEPGNMLSEIIGKPFSESEKGNQVFIGVVRYHQILKDIDTWQRRKGTDSITTRLANRLGLALKDPVKYHLQEHGSKVLEALEKGEPITDDLINEALHYTVRDKAFPIVLSTKPMWWETQPLLKIFTQFKTWPKEQLGMIWNDVLKYTVKTGDPKRLAGFIIGTIFAGELYNIARDYLYEKDESLISQVSKSPENRHWAKAVINDLLDGGVVGILADFTYGIYDWALGPSATTVRNFRDTWSAAFHRPAMTIPAISRLIQQEATPVRQAMKTWDKIDRRFINKRNLTRDYFKVRDWAWQYKEGYLKPDMLDRIQGVADDLIYGKVRYKPGDNTLAYQMAARQIMVGDIEDAKAYFKNIIESESKEFETLDEKERQKKRLDVISIIERTMKQHYSPYGHILDEKEADFLNQLPENERNIAKAVQDQWRKNMAEALYSLIPAQDLQNLIHKNTSHDIDKPETLNRPHKGKEQQVEQWRAESQRRK